MSKVHGRGRLSDADKARIQELAEQGLKAWKISREIKRHPSTVYWHMLSCGLVEAKLESRLPMTYTRNGRTVYRFSPEEDAFITALRIKGDTFQAIADQCVTRFGIKRTAHGIHVRSIMLSTREDEPA